MEGLGPTDAVVLEASTGSFWWADQIEAKGAKCFVMDPRKFRIIKDSWNKTDRHDARNLAKALWVHVVTGEFGIPTAHKPTAVVRDVRKEMNVSAASRLCLELTLQVLWKVEEAKKRLATEILLAGEPLKSEVELLISIKGVTPLIALAFLADADDPHAVRAPRCRLLGVPESLLP